MQTMTRPTFKSWILRERVRVTYEYVLKIGQPAGETVWQVGPSDNKESVTLTYSTSLRQWSLHCGTGNNDHWFLWLTRHQAKGLLSERYIDTVMCQKD